VARKDECILDATRIAQRTAVEHALVLGRRMLAAVAAAALLGALFFSVSPVLPADWVPWRAETVLPEPVLPARPASIPAHVPGWAWEMQAWHAQRPIDRGRRPRGAPQRLPEWYWEWRAWRAAVSG
jgi:hypothetical protein